MRSPASVVGGCDLPRRDIAADVRGSVTPTPLLLLAPSPTSRTQATAEHIIHMGVCLSLLRTWLPSVAIGPPKKSSILTLFHFNDVYNVETKATKAKGGAARFVSAMLKAQAAAADSGVCFFSGDCFNPAIMSTVVKGAQMPLVLKQANVKCAVVGNHDFDHGPERLAELVAQCPFPWLLSNVQHARRRDGTHRAGYRTYAPVVAGLKEFAVLHVGGRRVGVIGCVEEDWLDTLYGVPRSSIAYEDFRVVAARLSLLLRLPPHSCDAVVALTHMRQPNDDALARSCPDLDAILAGHDHHYGVTEVCGTSIFKSGTDFETFTSIELALDAGDWADAGDALRDDAVGDASGDAVVPFVLEEEAEAVVAAAGEVSTDLEAGGAGVPDASRAATSAVRSRIVSHRRHDVTVEVYGEGDVATAAFLRPLEAQVESMLGASLCACPLALDCTRDCLRLSEAPLGNLVTDVLRAATGAEVCLINAGLLRAERVLSPGDLTMRELFEILPMMDAIAVVRVSGATLLRALENAVSRCPKKDGRFAQVSGLAFVWDAARPAGERVLAHRVRINGKPLAPADEYTLCSREFICIDGKDGYDCFVGCPVLVDAETHPALPILIQRHLEALGKRGEPLLCHVEGRIVTAADDANRPSSAEAASAPPTRRFRRISKDVFGHDEGGYLEDSMHRTRPCIARGEGEARPAANAPSTAAAEAKSHVARALVWGVDDAINDALPLGSAPTTVAVLAADPKPVAVGL